MEDLDADYLQYLKRYGYDDSFVADRFDQQDTILYRHITLVRAIVALERRFWIYCSYAGNQNPLSKTLEIIDSMKNIMLNESDPIPKLAKFLTHTTSSVDGLEYRLLDGFRYPFDNSPEAANEMAQSRRLIQKLLLVIWQITREKFSHNYWRRRDYPSTHKKIVSAIESFEHMIQKEDLEVEQ